MAQTFKNSSVSDVKNFGAVPIKDSVSTQAIQKAIDRCALVGGGTVYFGPGQYTSGQLYLKSNVTIYLDAGATLYASRNPDHFKKPGGTYEAGNQIAPPNETSLFLEKG